MTSPNVQTSERRSPWLTPDEAAEYIRRKRTTIYKLISERQIASHHPDGSTLLHVDDLDKWVSKSRREAL
jgi:excisionase family DNA binding protein